MHTRLALLLLAGCVHTSGWEPVRQELNAIRVEVGDVHQEIASLGDDVRQARRTRQELARAGMAFEPLFTDEAYLDPIEVVPGGHFVLDDAIVRALRDPERLARRGYPHIAQRRGELLGVRLAHVHSNSLVFRLGLRTGDVVRAIDDVPLTSPDWTDAAIRAATETRRVRLTLQRRWRRVALTWEIDAALPTPDPDHEP